MVKSKKNRRDVAKSVSSESEVDVKEKQVVWEKDDCSQENITMKNKKNQKATKSNKNKSNNSESEAESGSNDSDDMAKVTPQVKEKQKPNKRRPAQPKSSFMLLSEDDADNNPPAKESDSESETEQVLKKNKVTAKKNKKGKKANEEDLDKILADLKIEYAADEESSEKLNTENPKNSDGTGSTMLTAAEKKKLKKERQKREAMLAKKVVNNTQKPEADNPPEKTMEPKSQESDSATKVKQVSDLSSHAQEQDTITEESTAENVNSKSKKKAKKEKKSEVEPKKDTKKKGMSAAVVTAMQERLKKIKEEEERERLEEEERIKKEEEREQQRLEAIRLEAEKKEKKKQKELERKARLKAEGKLLTKKEKEDRARAQAMLEALKAQGLEIPDPSERRGTRPGTRIRPKKKPSASKEKEVTDAVEEKTSTDTDLLAQPQSNEIKEEVIKDSWDATESEDDGDIDDDNSQATSTTNNDKASHQGLSTVDKAEASSDNDDNSELNDNSESEEYESDKESMPLANDPEARRLRAESRISARQSAAEKKQSLDNLRAAVVCVLGHVDTGKTKILDKLRRTHVQDSEAGGITQQIGATNVPIDAIKEQSKCVFNANNFEHLLPGLLIIDTPGHESFSNLRNRGSSLCDISILVVDIMHGLEPQTLESINLLKSKKCPFIVALNKIDRLYDWKVMTRRDIRDIIKEQQPNTQLEFQQRTKEVILQFAEQGLNAALFYENPDPKTYVSIVPTSAITGEGMGNLLFLIVEFCQKMLAKRLMYSEELQATVLEVKALPGLGTTIDAILINGKLREGETMVLAGTDGPIVTQIRSLLMPQPLKELRVKNAYMEFKEVNAAQGVKIAAKDLDKAIAGINLLIAHKPDEVEICKEEVARELKSALSHIKLAQVGVYVQASTLGSLEALLEFLRTSKIPYSAIRIGPVVKRDVMKASTMLEHEPQYATILAFDVKVERDAQEMADSVGVKIFQADIIYHLFDKFMAYREDIKQKKREQFSSIAIFPCKLKILPQFIFNSRDPIVMGVMVENGIVKIGTPICVPSKEFVEIGIVSSIESNHKQLESARKGQEICIKIDPIPGESPKMFGRHFEATDMLVSKISRQSIDACKDYFRDDLIKADWSLMVELKKLFEIL